MAALVAELPDRPKLGVYAVIIRRPDDEGIPTVILQESTADPEVLSAAVRVALSTTRRSMGGAIRKEVRMSLRRSAQSPPNRVVEPKWALALADLRAQVDGNVPGVGRGRALMLTIPRAKTLGG